MKPISGTLVLVMAEGDAATLFVIYLNVALAFLSYD
jgi:hypothetical protein